MMQTLVTVTLFVATVMSARFLPLWAVPLLLPLFIGLLTRLFVLFHDAGHESLVRGRRLNRVLGHALSLFFGISWLGWKHEHDWHHNHQGQLDDRGIDQLNSPMTVEEISERYQEAQYRDRVISPMALFWKGPIYLLWDRKFLDGFFVFRKGFRWDAPNRTAIRADIVLTLIGHTALHAAAIAWLGIWAWLLLVPLGLVLACGVGSLLFWVQHNFERTWHAKGHEWRFAEVALNGSSYLRLPVVLDWFTASIGLHHVHHLNARIPNYRLEEARSEIDALRAVEPLNWSDFRLAFRKMFWSAETGRMLTLSEAVASTVSAAPEAADADVRNE